jgi:uncharacterized DUF497 family protein
VRHERFEWGLAKAKANLVKHGISFEEAAAVLADPFAESNHLTMFDARHSEQEDRWKTVGSYPFDRSKIMVIVWTTRPRAPGQSVTRIISARAATQRERKEYKNETSNP